MKRNRLFFIIITALVLLFSCGIPNVYVPDSSDITITPVDVDKGTFTITLSDTILGELSDSFPTLYFLYTISSGDQTSYYKSALDKFNSSYADETSGAVIPNDNPLSSTKYTSSNKDYYVYQLTRSSEIFTYTLGNDTSSTTLTLYLDTSTNSLTLTDTAGNIIYSEIKRADNKTFKLSDGTSDIVDYADGTYTVNIYLVVSCKFDSYTNTYNKKINTSSPIYTFQINS